MVLEEEVDVVFGPFAAETVFCPWGAECPTKTVANPEKSIRVIPRIVRACATPFLLAPGGRLGVSLEFVLSDFGRSHTGDPSRRLALSP